MNSFVFSKLYYCSTVWSNTSKHNINKLQLVQNFAARVVLGLKKFDHISQAIKSLNWLPVNDRIYLNDAVMMYKCTNKLVPDYLIEKFTLRSQTHTRNTRQRDQLNIPRCRLTTGQGLHPLRMQRDLHRVWACKMDDGEFEFVYHFNNHFNPFRPFLSLHVAK